MKTVEVTGRSSYMCTIPIFCIIILFNGCNDPDSSPAHIFDVTESGWAENCIWNRDNKSPYVDTRLINNSDSNCIVNIFLEFYGPSYKYDDTLGELWDGFRPAWNDVIEPGDTLVTTTISSLGYSMSSGNWQEYYSHFSSDTSMYPVRYLVIVNIKEDDITVLSDSILGVVDIHNNDHWHYGAEHN